MRKTITISIMLMVALVCSTLTMAQRPYTSQQGQPYQQASSNDSVLRLLRLVQQGSQNNGSYPQGYSGTVTTYRQELRDISTLFTQDGSTPAEDLDTYFLISVPETQSQAYQSQSTPSPSYQSQNNYGSVSQNSPSAGQSSQSQTYQSQSYPSSQSAVVIYPKIRATVGSEIIVEPAQTIQNSQQLLVAAPQGAFNSRLEQVSGNNTGLQANNGSASNAAAGKSNGISELYTIVDGDTISVILPQKNFGRFDRGLYNYLYIPKGRWAFGLTASYGEFSTEDIEMLNILKDFDIKGKLYSINPFVTYFFRSNQSMGLRLNYTRGEADLGSMVFDFDEDMAFDLKDISFYYEGYSMSVFYRNYVGLDQKKRFSVFNDVDLKFSSGSSRFKRYYDQVTRDTQTTSMGVSLNFSPGVCVFIMDNAAFNVSFGVFGVSMHKDQQITDGVLEGSRISSGANFKFNLFNINFGLMIVI